MNWGPGEPNDAGEGEQCGEMTMWNGNWNDDNCGTEQRVQHKQNSKIKK